MKKVELFDKVKCCKYIVKNKEYKEFSCSNELITLIEDNKIILGKNESYSKDIYIVKEKIFTGIVVGIYTTYAKRIISNNSTNGKNYLCNKKMQPFKVAKVYFANNKSRLVPLKYIKSIK